MHPHFLEISTGTLEFQLLQARFTCLECTDALPPEGRLVKTMYLTGLTIQNRFIKKVAVAWGKGEDWGFGHDQYMVRSISTDSLAWWSCENPIRFPSALGQTNEFNPKWVQSLRRLKKPHVFPKLDSRGWWKTLHREEGNTVSLSRQNPTKNPRRFWKKWVRLGAE